MNIFLLDTNIISEPSKPFPNQNVVSKIADNIEHSCICSVVWAEVLSGVKSLPNGHKKEALFDFFIETAQKNYEILPFDYHCASVYSDLIERLKEKGNPLPKFDLMIAATAIANGLILVTRNTKDFEPIAEVSTLPLENWFSVAPVSD